MGFFTKCRKLHSCWLTRLVMVMHARENEWHGGKIWTLKKLHDIVGLTF